MNIIYTPIAWLLNLCNSFTFNYVLTLLAFAIIVKLILLPLSIKQHTNSLKQARLRPKEAAIMKKYKGRNDRASQQKRQMEIQELHQSGGYSQFAGCLPMLIQLPLIICIYNVVRSPLTHLCRLGKNTVAAIKEMAGVSDEIMALSALRADFNKFSGIEGITPEVYERLPNFTLFGVDLASTPQFGIDWLMIIPVLTFVFTFISSKLTRKLSYQSPQMQQGGDDVRVSMNIMDFALPLLSTFITFSVPAVIGIYWIYQNLLGVLQQFIVVKIKPFPVFTEEDYKEAEREVLGKKKKKNEKKFKDPNRPRVRSLHRIDDEEYNAKVVDNGENRASDVRSNAGGLLTPVPMKDYSDKDNKKK